MRSINFSNADNKLADPNVICLMGATATGKTELAIEIAERFPVELISVDSALIYRDMNIGTAKPDADLLKKAPHFLIDIIDPAENYSAWDFITQVRQFIKDINHRGNIPLLVGGTMMYYHVLEAGLNRLPQADQSIRSRLEAEARKIGWPAMHRRLADSDPETASRVKPGDRQRVQRALEVFEIAGIPLSELQAKTTQGYQGQMHKIVLQAEDRALLHARIEKRFHVMLKQGFIDEVALLRDRGDLDLSMPSMRCVGYRQVWQYLDGDVSEDEMTEKAIAATRQLAKRQITWLRKQPQISTFDCLNYRKDAIFKLLSGSFSD